MICRHCKTPLEHMFADLGFAPPSNAYRTTDDLCRPEIHYPLRVWVCSECWLLQTEDVAEAETLFGPDYAYFSSVSSVWLEHASNYADEMVDALELGSSDFVVEIASNDGYLLRNFVQRGIPCLGIEPTAGTAAAAERAGIPTLQAFFGENMAVDLAARGMQADLLVGNNVFAHVPDINDFTRGMATLLKPQGTITLEFPHAMRLIEGNQFDTLYHEHFSYLSLWSVCRIFAAARLRVFDVHELPTHGGSLRVFGCHEDDPRNVTPAVDEVLTLEDRHGLRRLETYTRFPGVMDKIKDDLLCFLLEQKRQGAKVSAYGAAAKGNTLLNYSGIGPDLVNRIYDAGAEKQGKYAPGSHIPILSPEYLRCDQPDVLLILPWNIADEIKRDTAFIREWGATYAQAVPELRVD